MATDINLSTNSYDPIPLIKARFPIGQKVSIIRDDKDPILGYQVMDVIPMFNPKANRGTGDIYLVYKLINDDQEVIFAHAYYLKEE